MYNDQYGQMIFDENDLCDLYLKDPTRKLRNVLVDCDIELNKLELVDKPTLVLYQPSEISVQEFDHLNQNNWYIPEKYKNFDIAKWVLEQCHDESELQRAGQELLLFQEREMFPLLQYLKYLVDTMRDNNIVWGVGRGSSVSSYVLYIIGIHKINSLYYDLSIDEFLK